MGLWFKSGRAHYFSSYNHEVDRSRSLERLNFLQILNKLFPLRSLRRATNSASVVHSCLVQRVDHVARTPLLLGVFHRHRHCGVNSDPGDISPPQTEFLEVRRCRVAQPVRCYAFEVTARNARSREWLNDLLPTISPFSPTRTARCSLDASHGSNTVARSCDTGTHRRPIVFS